MFPEPRTFGCSPALVLGPGPQFVFTGPGPQLAFAIPGPQFIFTGPGLQFYYQSGAWLCIYLIMGSSSSGSSNSSSSNFFGINSTNICMSILVN